MSHGPFIRPLLPRDRDEPHRAATQLELLFDLVFVIAIAAASHGLAHELEEGHVIEGIVKYLLVFWCVWWPWNLYTWFASAFDNGDVPYRITVMVLMSGAMFVAAATPGFFVSENLRYMFSGYIIMRLAFASLWLRVARAKPCYRRTARIYVGGQMLMQVYWAVVVFLVPRHSLWFDGLFGLGIVIEMLIPMLGEKAGNTQWHRHHIIERFGLLNIIVLGEVLLGATTALEAAMAEHFFSDALLLFCCALVIAFSMWWLYFSKDDHLSSHDVRMAFVWAYGHFLVYAGGAAVGAGLAVHASHAGHLDTLLPSLALAVPVATYVLGLWLIRDRFVWAERQCYLPPIFIVLVLGSAWLPYTPVLVAGLLVTCLVLHLRAQARAGA